MATALNKAVECDAYETVSTMSRRADGKVYFALSKNGVLIATILMGAADIKKLKGQIAWWKELHSGLSLMNRHGNHS